MSISVTGPVGQAIDRARLMTFQPFDISRWFALGFVAWLSALGEGGVNFNFSNPGDRGGGGGGTAFDDVGNWISANLTLVIVLAAVAVVLILAIGLAISWLKSRATFMFIDNIACNHNPTQIARPWRAFRAQGNSLFLFWLCLGLIATAAVLVITALCFLISLPDIHRREFGGSAIVAILVGFVLLLSVFFIVAVISACTSNFVVPLMYLRRSSTLAAWREFRLTLLPGNAGAIVLFFLMKIALAIAVGIISVLAGCFTCCLGFLPYLSAVLTLPLHIFLRAYSLYFVQQFGPGYNIVSEPLTAGFSVISPSPPGQPPAPPTLPPPSK
ncbi:MAG: hypothetical protein LLG01_09885 [Planctomycetaceae bacterium]|nr:hypothetical protein [Planctomycetaceae bacterium]